MQKSAAVAVVFQTLTSELHATDRVHWKRFDETQLRHRTGRRITMQLNFFLYSSRSRIVYGKICNENDDGVNNIIYKTTTVKLSPQRCFIILCTRALSRHRVRLRNNIILYYFVHLRTVAVAAAAGCLKINIISSRESRLLQETVRTGGGVGDSTKKKK